jgi:hypothetical protein
MPAPVCTTEEFIALWTALGTPTKVAGHLGVSTRSVMGRRSDIEARLGITLETRREPTQAKLLIKGARIEKTIQNGRVVVFSDAHYYPNIKSTAHRALLKLIPKFKPVAIVNNGDCFDGGSISRYPRIGWDAKPKVMDELKAVKDRLDEVEAIRGHADLIWSLGNHDARYECWLAANAPQFEGVQGFHLKDHFPLWRPCWRVDINPGTDSWVIIKHRWKGGVHATRNNALNAGSVSYVTGHLHSQKVAPLTTARNTCWGVDCGTLADPQGPQFEDYLESSDPDWRSGFILLTFVDGRLLTPEMIRVVDEGLVEFRGELIEC